MSTPPTILFTAFEPSGDALAAPVIAELKRRLPEVRIYAFGGPQMQASGATLIEHTTDHAVMLGDAVRQVMAHRARLRRLRAWMQAHPVDEVVPVDSPAANWDICKLTRELAPSARIVHLVMPQLWAWASWRLNKLRRLSDHVLCLLPFEREWLAQRGVPATFVGHPLFETPDDHPAPDTSSASSLPETTAPKLALLPGSRQSEVKANWPTMLAAHDALHHEHPNMQVCVAASDAERLAQLEAQLPDQAWPAHVHTITADATAALDWADAALVVSGTATLHAASRHTPMVVLYNVSRWSWHLLGRWLISTRTFSLPNLIGEHLELGRVVPELVPHFGEVEPVIGALWPLIAEDDARQAQRAAFERITQCFAGRGFAAVSADRLLEMVGVGERVMQ